MSYSVTLLEAIDPAPFSFFGITCQQGQSNSVTKSHLSADSFGSYTLTRKAFNAARHAIKRNVGRPDDTRLLVSPAVLRDFETWRMDNALGAEEQWMFTPDLGDDINTETRGGPRDWWYRSGCAQLEGVAMEMAWNDILATEVPNTDPASWAEQLLCNLERLL